MDAIHLPIGTIASAAHHAASDGPSVTIDVRIDPHGIDAFGITVEKDERTVRPV